MRRFPELARNDVAQAGADDRSRVRHARAGCHAPVLGERRQVHCLIAEPELPGGRRQREPIFVLGPCNGGGTAWSAQRKIDLQVPPTEWSASLDDKTAIMAGDVGRDPEREPHPWVSAAGDRKSTRLNSSHVEISYAVFC